jgi:hypothetical protein
MKTAVQDYIEKYITTPDIDIMSDTNREFIYQEGGYSRFFPVLPGGYQPIQAPTGTPPQDNHALWNSVSQNLLALGRQGLANREMKMRESQNKIDNELGFARLELAKQQLSQQDEQFKISSAFEQMRMSNTLFDRVSKVEFPSYRQKEYEDYIGSPDGIATNMKAYEDAVAADDLNAQLKAANKINAAMSNPNIIKWSMEKKRDDETLKDLEILAKADPLSLQYKNISEVASAVVSGQQPPPVDWVGVTPEEKALSAQAYEAAKAQDRELSIQTRETAIWVAEAKAGLAEIDAMMTQLDVDEARLLKETLDAALALPEYANDPEKRLKLIRDHKEVVRTEAAKTAAIRAGATLNDPSNQWEYVPWLLRNNPGMSRAEAEKIAAEKVRNEKSSKVSYNGLYDPNGGGPGGGQQDPITNKLATNILDATNRQMDTWGPIQSADRGTVNDVVETNKGYYKFRSVNPSTKTPINEAVTLGKDDEYLVTQVRIDSNGKTVSVLGSVKTTDEKLAKKLSPGIKPNEDGEYIIPNVMSAGDKADFGLKGLNTSDPDTQPKSTSQQSTTQGQPPYAAGPNQTWENVNGKWILVTIKK